ncbi:MAG: phospholipase D-like domain-containing protein, partial [Cyanobium sp.]
MDRRLLDGGLTRCSQHAKVVLADAGTTTAQALVTSANFSENAQRHNFEAGWLVHSPWRVEQVHQHF